MISHADPSRRTDCRDEVERGEKSCGEDGSGEMHRSEGGKHNVGFYRD